MQLDPLSIVVHQAMGEFYYLQGDFHAAVLAYEKGLELGRNDASLHQYLSWPHEQLGLYEEAIALHKAAVELSQRAPVYLSGLGYSYGIAGRREDALQILEELKRSNKSSSYDLALVHLGLGDFALAISLFEQAYDAKDGYLPYLLQDPKFDPLRDNGRFIALLKRITKE